MITQLTSVFDEEQLAQVDALINNGDFIDGKATAGWHSAVVKENLQWHGSQEDTDALHSYVSTVLVSHPEFARVTYARNISPLLVSESRDGGHYGPHIDDALVGDDFLMRTDVSFTVFLSAPETYVGGELEMDICGMRLPIKMQRGDVVLYPSTTCHQVKPVTAGTRRVAVGWIESYVRSAEQRELLNDLDTARREVMAQAGKTQAFDLISKAHANLLRRWSNT